MDGIELVDSRNPPENAAICRCSDDPKPHVHYLCEIDRYVPADAGVGVHADVDAGLRTKDIGGHITFAGMSSPWRSGGHCCC